MTLKFSALVDGVLDLVLALPGLGRARVELGLVGGCLGILGDLLRGVRDGEPNRWGW